MGIRDKKSSTTHSFSTVVKSIQIGNDQSLERNKISDSCTRFVYIFFGEVWEKVARSVIASGGKAFWMNYFHGATVDQSTKTISLPRGFGSSIFMDRYASMIEDWNFVISKSRPVNFGSGGEHDTLTQTINGKSFSDIEMEFLEKAA